MNRTIVNLLLDILLALILCFLVGSACVVRFVFPPGTEAKGWKLWGMDYDAWANFEFLTLCVILLAFVVHVMLHWNWVCSVIATRVFKLRGSSALTGRGNPDPLRRHHVDCLPRVDRRFDRGSDALYSAALSVSLFDHGSNQSPRSQSTSRSNLRGESRLPFPSADLANAGMRSLRPLP